MAERQNPDKEQIFTRYHDKLREELNNAHWHFEIWKQLRNKLKPDYLDEFNQAPAFFGLTMHAHLLATIMRLNNICDKDTDTVNIQKLLNYTEQNSELFTDEAFEIRQRGKSNYEVAMAIRKKNPPDLNNRILQQERDKFEHYSVNNLKVWRDKAIAHIDKEVILKDISVFKEYPVKISEIEQIINDINETLNTLLVAFNGVSWSKGLPVAHNVDIVFDAMRSDLQQRRARIQRTDN
ncbi:hypothetical protein ACFLXG_05400 [Chloroflexota bacterium]